MAEPIKFVPAPWDLTGEGTILVFKSSNKALENQTGVIYPGLKFNGGIRLLMAVHYQSSDAGPYDELLYMPGGFLFNERPYYVISTIFVSTLASVENGRKNWGIPKHLADSSFNKSGNTSHFQFNHSQTGEPIGSLDYSEKSFGLPFSTGIVPKRLRTLIQYFEDTLFYTSPEGKGSISRVKINNLSLDETLFPDLNQDHLLFAIKANHFQLKFPKAEMVSVRGS